MNVTHELRKRMIRFTACIAMAMLCFSTQAIFAQEPEPDGYDFEISDFPPEAFPVTLDITFQNGMDQLVVQQNGADRITAQYGQITSINVTTPLEGDSWFVNDPPGPHRVYPGQWPWSKCLYVQNVLVEYFDPALQRIVRFLKTEMRYGPCL